MIWLPFGDAKNVVLQSAPAGHPVACACGTYLECQGDFGPPGCLIELPDGQTWEQRVPEPWIPSPEELARLRGEDFDTRRIVWCDVETTGLDPEDNLLLEVAIVITDNDLRVVYENSWVIYHEIMLNVLEPYILDMHMANGLLHEVVKSSFVIEDVNEALVSLFSRSDIFPDPWKDKPSILAGSSVQFDRSWLKVWFPEFEKRLHYRNIDVSTLKELVDRWCRELAFQPNSYHEKKHRAMDDIKQSIAELAWYRSQFFS